jgi:ABC-2 type transport system permease protein
MAQLAASSSSDARWSATQTRSQFAAIAWLRWRIFVNSFRRKGGTGELVGNIFLYILFGSLALIFVASAGIAAYFFAAKGQLSHISWLLWAIFILCQLLNIQLGQPGTTFDPTQLIRFPLRVDTYIFVRLFFGLLTPANIVGTLMSFAIAVGITIAVPALWFYALLALAIFAATNVLFSRMIFAWVDRWLSTRRAREVFTALIFAVSLGIQWANFTFNPAYNHHHTRGISPQSVRIATDIYHRVHPLIAYLPPELTASSLVAIHRAATSSFFVCVLGSALFAALFFAVFALRMRTEFRGESLSDAANAVPRKAATSPAANLTPSTVAPSTLAPAVIPSTDSSNPGVPPVILAILGKELLYVRRHTGILYGLIMPIFLVLVFAGKFAARSNSTWIFPAAVAYTLLAIAPLSYNSFGLEAAGSQLYYLAPVRMRDILLAKNLMGFLMALVEVLAIFGIISYMAGVPAFQTAAAALLWAAGTLAINDIFGNQRSFTNPKKINPQRMANKQTSQVSAFISLGILTLSYGLASGLFFLCIWLHQNWALVPVAALFAATGIALYINSLRSIDQFARDHREELFTELCKQN